MHLNIPDLIGWTGTCFYIIAYLLLSLGKIKAGRPLYHCLNMVGAAGLITNAIRLDDYPNIIVNLIWLIIAFSAVILIISRRRHAD
jgi:hypothetical protein